MTAQANQVNHTAVVLIHGYPLNQRIWKHQLSLSKHFNVLTPDLPGFGQNAPMAGLSMTDYADYVAELLDRAKADKALVAGHSMGGYIALEFAKQHPERLLGLGLINTQAGADSDEARANRYRSIERVHKEGSGFIIEAMKEKLLSPDRFRTNPDLVSEIESIMREASLPGIATALQAMARRSDHETTLRDCRVPVLIITGKDDLLIPPEESRTMAGLVKQSTLRELEGVGHLAMLESPDRFNSELTSFLSTLS